MLGKRHAYTDSTMALQVPATFALPSSLSGQAVLRLDHFEISSPPSPSNGVARFLHQHFSFLAPIRSFGPPVVEVAPGRKVTRLAAAKLPEYKKVDDFRHPSSQQATVSQENDTSDIDSLPDSQMNCIKQVTKNVNGELTGISGASEEEIDIINTCSKNLNMDNDHMDPYQLYHMHELAEDEIDDEDELRRHKIAVLGAVIFQEAKNRDMNASVPRRRARRIYLIRTRNDRAFITTMAQGNGGNARTMI
ncbi:hypothetical protein F4604DRAFT_1901696 [Suillus subluteus]|nr:hypothetical protein F4604DRAFT_1901696 [Suillus subluteus]